MLAHRYARALRDAAEAPEALEAAGQVLRAFCEICETDTALRHVLSNPVLDAERRVAVAATALKALEASDLVTRFVELLVRRNRIGLLPEVVRQVDNTAAESLNRVVVDVVTASPLTDALEQRLRTSLEKFTNKTVVMRTTVDPGIIGGLVVYMWGMFFDFSLRTRLDGLRRKLLTDVELTYES